MQILNDLKRAGLVDSRRGAAGGYLLAREPSTIRLSHVVEAVEPALLTTQAAQEGESGASVAQAWNRISTIWRQSLDDVKLDSLAQQPGDGMFYI